MTALQIALERDPITGFAAGEHVTEILDAEMERARALSRPLTLLVAGVETEDALPALANVIEATSRTRDIACCIGATELGLVLPGSGIRGGLALATRMRSHVDLVDADDPLWLWIGLAELSEEGIAADEFFARASLALAEARSIGDDRTVCFGFYRAADTRRETRRPAAERRLIGHLSLVGGLLSPERPSARARLEAARVPAAVFAS